MTAELHQTRMATAAEPPFHDEVEAVWGRPWGAADEVGRLRSVLVRPPGPALDRIRADAWDADLGALVDPDGGWYWTRREPPDVARAEAQHAGLVAALEADGVEVVTAASAGQRLHQGDVRARPADHRPRRRRDRADGGADAARRGGGRHARRRRGRAADPRHDDGHGDDGGRLVRQAPPRARGARHLDPLQPGGRAPAAGGAGRGRLGADRRAAARLHDPHRRAPRDGRPGPGADRRGRAAVLLPRAPARRGHRDDPRRARRGVGHQPAHARAAAGADVRRQPAHGRAARRRGRRGADRPVRRAAEQRRRRALLHDGARAPAGRPSRRGPAAARRA